MHKKLCGLPLTHQTRSLHGEMVSVAGGGRSRVVWPAEAQVLHGALSPSVRRVRRGGFSEVTDGVEESGPPAVRPGSEAVCSSRRKASEHCVHVAAVRPSGACCVSCSGAA